MTNRLECACHYSEKDIYGSWQRMKKLAESASPWITSYGKDEDEGVGVVTCMKPGCPWQQKECTLAEAALVLLASNTRKTTSFVAIEVRPQHKSVSLMGEAQKVIRISPRLGRNFSHRNYARDIDQLVYDREKLKGSMVAINCYIITDTTYSQERIKELGNKWKLSEKRAPDLTVSGVLS